MIEHVELLSPAGSYECAVAAISAGADAVYLGLARFGARANAANLTPDELKRVIDTAHILGRRIYLTVNTLFKDDELGELYDFLKDAYEYGLDAAIVQDIGAMSYICEVFPDLPIHVSTQAAITSADGAKLLKNYNVKRIVPARELSLYEISKLKEATGLEIECFVHGSLCYSYSGKCLLSSMIGGRSGNRGRCAQPCRLMYDGTYPLSLKDLCTIDMIPELIGAGISSFKIEGRMKNSGYVYGVTSIYRKYLDMFYQRGTVDVSDEDKKRLLSLYTRSGNCDGYYKCHNGRHMITPISPSYMSNTDEEGNATKLDIPTTSVTISCSIKRGSHATIKVADSKLSVVTKTPIIADEAMNRSLTVESVAKQLVKSGGTGFNVTDTFIDLDDGLFLPNGSLNEIRRSGLEAFKESILKQYQRDADQSLRHQPPGGELSSGSSGIVTSPRVHASVLSKQQLEAVLESEVDSVIIPMALFKELCKDGKFDHEGKSLYIALPYVVREEKSGYDRNIILEFVQKYTIRYDIAGYYVSNLESVSILKECGYSGSITSDIFIYAYNRRSCEELYGYGVSTTTVPVELNERELYRRTITGEELIIYGRIPVMVSANCIFRTENGCSKTKGHMMYLSDRKNEKLFVFCDCNGCVNIIYNSVRHSICDEDKLFLRLAPSSVRLCFTDEDANETAKVLDMYLKNRKFNGSAPVKLCSAYTKGHLKRGVD